MSFRGNLLRRLIVCDLALCAPLAAVANDGDYFAELPVVLSASRLAQPLREAPGAMTVIDRELIRASGARVISDLLRLVPGFQVTTPSSESARVTYHGLSDEFPSHLQVLVDGVSQYSQLYRGGVNWNLIPVAIQDIERIEVLRGSNSAAYGANAFLGVVSIITQQAAQTRGTAFSVSNGNGATRDYFARWGASAPGADFRFSVSRQADSGINKKFDETTLVIQPFNDDRDNRVVNLRGDFYPSDSDVVRLSFSQVQNTVGQDGASDVPYYDFRQRNQTLQANWQRTLSPSEEIRINYALTREHGDDTHFEYPEGFAGTVLSINNGGNVQRQDFDAQHIVSPSPGLRVVWGLGLRSEWLEMPFSFYGNPRQSRSSKRIFSNAEWTFAPGWLLNFGGGLENDSLGGTMPAPRISLHRHFDDENTIRLGASRAFRAPSLIEQNSDQRYVPIAGPLLGNYLIGTLGALSRLNPERIDSFEFGYLGNFRKYNASLDVRVFLERIPNLIQRIPTLPGVPLPAPYCPDPASLNCMAGMGANYPLNIEQVYIRGLEYQFRWLAPTDTRLVLNQAFTSVAGSVADVSAFDRPYDRLAENAKIIRHADTSAPASTTTLMAIQRLPWNIQASVTLSRVGQMRWTRNQLPVDSYHRVDWRLWKTMKINGQNVEIAYTGRSTNDEHGEYRPNWLVPPRHFLTLSMGI